MLNICICQLIKDEQRYIEEWIDYHLNLGISKFVLFEDYNSTSHSEVLSKYGNKVILYKLLDVLNDDEIKVIKDNNVVHSNIRLKHYLTKSWDEYKWRIYERGEPADEYYSRQIEHFFEINDDLIQYKEQLLNECKGLKSKHNINE